MRSTYLFTNLAREIFIHQETFAVVSQSSVWKVVRMKKVFIHPTKGCLFILFGIQFTYIEWTQHFNFFIPSASLTSFPFFTILFLLVSRKDCNDWIPLSQKVAICWPIKQWTWWGFQLLELKGINPLCYISPPVLKKVTYILSQVHWQLHTR